MTTRVITELAPHPTAAQLLARRAEMAAKRPDLAQRIANEDRLAGREIMPGNIPKQFPRREQNDPEIAPTSSVGKAEHPRRRDLEHQEQKQLIEWADEHAAHWPELALLYAIPNGGSASSRAAAGRRKAEGQRRGVPDLCLPVPRGIFHGLYIELKAAGGRPSPEQRVWCVRLRDNGYRAEIVEGWEAARDLIVRYLTA